MLAQHLQVLVKHFTYHVLPTDFATLAVSFDFDLDALVEDCDN
mgnify:CR=1 FL=1